MAQYNDAVCRYCRREGTKLFLKGEKCFTKCTLERRSFAPGQHGQARRRKVSDYGLQLRAKQRARRIYGLLEKQFRLYFNRAEKQPGVTGLSLLQLLEMRLDNVVYRAGLASSRKEARQLVLHRHFLVNGRRVNIPSYQVRPGDQVQAVAASKDITPIAAAIELTRSRPVPSWLTLSVEERSAKVNSRPERPDIEATIEEQLIVEFYSR
jgi:small subunit ribosomal protein S4